MLSWVERTRRAQREVRAKGRVAQVESSPNEHAHKNGKKEPWIFQAHLRGGRTAQIAREQDRPQRRRARNHEDGEADELGDPKRADQARGIAQPGLVRSLGIVEIV